MFDWIRSHQAFFAWLGIGSLVMFVATLLLVPILVARMPVDYFQRDREENSRLKFRHPVLWLITVFVKNVLGLLLILMGFSMLFLPGQGILTILAGITLMDFPGKRSLVRWIVMRTPVRRAINWIRRKFHQPPLE